MRRKQITTPVIAIVYLIGSIFTYGTVAAQTSSSGNYQVNEYQFGNGGEVDLQSGTYRAVGSLGSLGVGNVSSANYDAEAGYITENEPFLEMYVSGATADLGDISYLTSHTAVASGGTCSCSFTIRTYLSEAYSVYTMSNPPTNSGTSLTAKTVLGAPSVATSVEEFGMNLVDNTTPNFGTNPVNTPSNTFADGTAATGYDTADQFKYNMGDAIARSALTSTNQAVGQTDYTITYIAKAKPTTAGGLYTMLHDIVVVATY